MFKPGTLAVLVLISATIPVFAQEEEPRIRVACIGDSITYAASNGPREETSYPAQLQTLLGKKYEVKNFGVSGATMLRVSERPYWLEKDFEAAKEFAPNIVVIMLGTNDSKPQHWNRSGYERDYRDMVDILKALPTEPQIIVVRPVPAFSGAFKIRNDIIVGDIIPVVDQIAIEKRVPVVDGYNQLLNEGVNFPDGIHPNAGGCKVLAKAVAEVVKAPALKYE